MVTKELRSWANAKEYRYLCGKNEECDVIERVAGAYTFTYSCDYNASKGGAAAYLGGAFGAALASGSAVGYVAKIQLNKDDWSKDILKEIKAEIKKTAKISYAGGILSIGLKKNKHVYETFEELDRISDITANILSARSVGVPDECGICGHPGSDSYALTSKSGSMLQPVHSSCAQTEARTQYEKLQKQTKNRQLFPGLLVGIVGIAVASLIPLALILLGQYYAGFINLIAYFFVPYIAIGFYNKGRGSASGAAFAVILILSLLSVIALMGWADFLWLEEYAREDFGIYITFQEYLSEFVKDPSYIVESIIEIILTLAFTVLGACLKWSRFKRTAGNQSYRLEAMQKTLDLQDTEAAPLDAWTM